MTSTAVETESEFDRLPEPHRSSLLFLRSLRDHLAESILADCPDLDSSVEQMIRYESEFSAFVRIKGRLTAGYYATGTERLKIFRLVCRRVARIERERLGAYIPSQLQDA